MVKLDDTKLNALITTRTLYSKINIAMFTACALFAIITATLAAALKQGTFIIVLLIILSAMILALILFNALFMLKASNELKFALAEKIAQAFYANEGVLKGKGKVNIDVTYESDVICAQSVSFDLSPLKKLPSFYSSFGTLIWAFLQAYYCKLPAGSLPEEVTVYDRTGGKAGTFVIVSGFKPCTNAQNNYFIKRNIVK